MDVPRQEGWTNGRDMSRAERFEDEKRRIVESCFAKKEVDGSLLETYITHLRITEYTSYPTSPPPPEARAPQFEKPRVIIVAVRKSGRVRMHKSKENSNGTFSIGKTWDLNDLTAIESYTGPNVDPLKKQWAADVGFAIHIGKAYYWQAQADKEKKFFVASLLKIYGKYTGGKTPELINFDSRELDQVLGSRKAPHGRTPPNEAAGARRLGSPPIVQGGFPASNAALASPPSRSPAAFQAYHPSGPPRPLRPISPGQNAATVASLNGGPKSPTPDLGRALPNQAAAFRPWAGSNPSSESVARSFLPPRSDDSTSLPPRPRGGGNGPGAYGRLGEPKDPTPFQQPQPFDLPERRRPPVPQGSTDVGDRDLVPAPLASPGIRRDQQYPMAQPGQALSTQPQPPPRSNERMSPQKGAVGQSSVVYSNAEGPSAVPDSHGLGTSDVEVNGVARPNRTAARSPTLEQTSAAPTPPPEASEEPTGDVRPGLGPMIKSKQSKGELAGTLWKAVSAAAAFKPRPGGAGERLRELARTNSDGPEVMTQVVPAPPRPTARLEQSRPVTPQAPAAMESSKSPKKNLDVPEVKITVPTSSRPSSRDDSRPISLVGELPEKRQSSEEVTKPQPIRDSVVSHGNDAKYLATLGVDSAFLDDRTTDFGKLLDQFGWIPGEKMRSRNAEEMKLDIDRELNKAQAGGWVVRFQDEDERIEAIKKGLDVAMDECEELDNLLTLYSVELSTLSDDIAYIEAQGQGLQVQAANQKLLKKELESLLETCAIQPEDLVALKSSALDSMTDLEEIEHTLLMLYKAMMKIDASMGASEVRKSEDTNLSDPQSGFITDYGKMRVVQEKKQMYKSSSEAFLQRFGEFMARQFDQAARETKKAQDDALSRKLDPRHHDVGRDLLWPYSPLILYAKDMNASEWDGLLQAYQEKSFALYRTELKEVISAWKRNARKATGDEAELLFTAQVEKQHESTITTARKLTVKRSQTLARTLRSPLGEGSSKATADKMSDSRSMAHEVFSGIMDDLLPLVEMEQNFIVDYFHATMLETFDFPDAVASALPKDRRGGDLRRHRPMEPDREIARRVSRSMEVIFSFLDHDLQQTVNWVVAQDRLQGVAVLNILERKQSDISQSNQDFLNTILQKLHANLESRFTKFVEEQIRAIEDTKVKIKKRKGVISFMRIFPLFSASIENMMVGADVNSSARRTVDREYERIIKTMFESLKVIARENPATLTSSGADPEDKEALNFHILLIENMNHFVEEVETRELDILTDWKEVAASELAEHMGLYLNAVMRRPLGKLLEYLENIEAQLASGKSALSISSQPSHSKGTFTKLLSIYDAKEVRKGVDALKKRVEKHFGDADESGSLGASRGLVNRVLRECERFYSEVEVRISTVTTTVYSGDILYEWPRAEVKATFALGR